MAIITQKDIIDVVRANIEIMEEIIETIDGTSYLKDKKKYDDKAISEHVKFLYGDPDKPKSGGKPSGLISELVVANDCLAKLAKVKAVNSKNIKKNAEKILQSINDVIQAVNDKMPADVKDIDQVTKNITNVKKIVDALMSVSKDIFILALISPLLLIASLLAILSVTVIMAFVWVVVTLMNMIKATVTKEQLESFKNVQALCRCIIIIDLEIIILALLAPIVAIAAVIALLGLGILTLCVWGMTFMLNFMVKLIKKVYDELAIVSMFFIVLILILVGISLGLLVVALIATVVVQLIPEVLIFLAMLIGIIIMLTVIGFILSKMTSILIEAMIGLVLLTVIMALITAVAVMLLIVAACAIFIVEHVGELFAFFGILIGVVVMMMALGAILMLAITPLAFCIAGLALLVVVVTELIAAATLLLILSLFKLDEAKIEQVVEAISNSLMTIVFKLILLAIPGLNIMVGQILMSLGLLLGVVAELIVAATELLILQLFNLDEKKLDKNISAITSSMYNIAIRLLPLAVPWLLAVFGWLLANVGLLLGVMVEFVAIGKKVQEIADLTIDEKKVMDNVTSIFNVLDLIFERLGDKKKANMRKKIARKAKKMFKHIRTALEYVSDIVNNFMKPIMDLELKERPIIKKVDVIFNTLDYIFERLGDKKAIKKRKKLAKKAKRMFKHIYAMMEYMNSIVNDFMKPITELDLKEKAVIKKVETIFNTLDYVFGRLGDKKAMKERKKAAKRAKRMMKQVGKVTNIIKDITDTLNAINEIKLRDNLIRKNLGVIFDCLDYVFERCGDKKAMKKRKKAAKRAKKMLKHVGQVVKIVKDMVELVNELSQVKVKTNQIQKNLGVVWDTVKMIETEIQKHAKSNDGGGGIGGMIKGWFKRRKKAKQAKNFMEHLGRIGQIVGIVNDMVEVLESLQEIKLKKQKIMNNLDAVWGVVEDIEKQIEKYCSPDSNVSGGNKKWWEFWKKSPAETKADKDREFMKHLGRVSNIIKIIRGITSTLDSMKKFKLNKTDMISKLDELFGVIEHIEAYIDKKFAKVELSWWDMWSMSHGYGWSQQERERAAEQIRNQQIQDYFKKINGLVGAIKGMADTFKVIEELKLDKGTVVTKLQDVFDIVEAVETSVHDYLQKGADALKAKYGAEWSKWSATNDDYTRIAMEWKAEEMDRMMSMIGPLAEVICSVGEIINALNDIQNLKISKKKVTNAIDGLFSFIDNELMPIIEGHKTTEAQYDNAIEVIESKEEIFEAIGKVKAYMDPLVELSNMKLSKSTLLDELNCIYNDIPQTVTACVGNLTEEGMDLIDEFIYNVKSMYEGLVQMQPFMTRLQDIANSKISKTSTNTLQILFSTIPSIISDAVDNMKFDLTKATKMEALIDTIAYIQDVLKDFQVSSTQVENQRKMTENYIKFLDAIDKVDNSNLKTSVSLFEQMARLSESISGNFDGLAQTINDKIAPLLEELNKLLEEVPEKIKEKTGGGSEGGSGSESDSKSEKKKDDKKDKEKGMDDVVAKLSKLIRVATDIKEAVD